MLELIGETADQLDDASPVDPDAPSWWRGEDEAASSNMALAASLGMRA